MEETLEGGRGPPRAVEPLERESVKILDYYNITVHSLECNKLRKMAVEKLEINYKTQK